MYRYPNFCRCTCRLPGRRAWRRSAECNCPLRLLPRATNKFFWDFSEELYSCFWTSFMNLIVVQCPAGTFHPQLHHPPRKLRSKGCHLYFSWRPHDSNGGIVFLDSMIFPHDNNCHNSCNLTPQETGCRPRSSASRSWDPGLDWTKVGKYIFRKSYFKGPRPAWGQACPPHTCRTQQSEIFFFYGTVNFVLKCKIWQFSFC